MRFLWFGVTSPIYSTFINAIDLQYKTNSSIVKHHVVTATTTHYLYYTQWQSRPCPTRSRSHLHSPSALFVWCASRVMRGCTRNTVAPRDPFEDDARERVHQGKVSINVHTLGARVRDAP